MDTSTMESIYPFGSDVTGETKPAQARYDSLDKVISVPPTSSPRPSSPSFYDSMDWNIAQLSPVGTASSCSDRTSSHVRNESNPINAVHMHVQENARIPNYNRPVDRSNSSIYRSVPRSTYNASETLITNNREPENSMAEIFLSSESKYRKSLSEAYEVIGSLEDVNFQREIDELATVSVDPTPWSEIKNKIDIEEGGHQAQTSQQEEATQTSHSQKSATKIVADLSIPKHPHQSSYYPYGRHHQLPIPEKSSPPRSSQTYDSTEANQGVSGMADAIAIAAAIASRNNTVTSVAENKNNGALPKRSSVPPQIMRGSPLAVVANSKASNGTAYIPTPGNQPVSSYSSPTTPIQNNTSTAKSSGVPVTLSNRHLQRQRAYASNPSAHAAAHSVRRASVVAATNRKSQYGFGGNHTVPSVPAPPSIRAANVPKTLAKGGKKIAPTIPTTVVPPVLQPKKPTPQMPRPIPNLPSNAVRQINPTTLSTIVQNSGSAYERKKQKAKDARVKLNESIERLSIAVSLAGSQSRSRINQLENKILMTSCRQKSIQVNQEGIKLAENAKKWDRPSFVGTAASIIQSLNSQCEALMTELITMQTMIESKSNQERNLTKARGDASERLVDRSSNKESSTIHHVHPNGEDNLTPSMNDAKSKQQEHGSTHASTAKRNEQPIDFRNGQTCNKRQRLTILSEEAQRLPDRNEVIFGGAAKFLDPSNLCRCVRVSKTWRDMKAFGDDAIWLELAVKRFGVYNVRQWSENLNDGESEDKIISNKIIYKEMDASNVMPHFLQEGMSLLGNGKIQGKISGWVFIIERSNGETLRSVKRDPNSGASGGGSYRSMPVVELQIVVQNTGMASHPVILKSQKIGVDVSTRRRGGELDEIGWDDRFKKIVRNIDGTIRPLKTNSGNGVQETLCTLGLFETAVIEVHINAKGCSTTSKFQQKSNFTKLLANLEGTTIPMVIPFLKDK